MKSSPIEEFHKGRNAAFVDHDAWRLPSHFGNPMAEYRTVRSTAGWLDLANRAVLSFSGPDATDWLQGMLSNDIKALGPGQGAQATILNIQGKILADVRVLCAEDAYLVDLWEPLVVPVLEHLNRYLVADEVEIDDRSGELTNISIQGPEARAVLCAILKTNVLPTTTLGHQVIQHNGRSVRVIASSHTGEEGFDVLLERDHLRQFLVEAQNEPLRPAIPWVGLEAQNMLRIEAGIPLYGVDMDDSTLLLETNLDAAVSFTKGCYLGQEIVERIHSRGHVNKKLVGITCHGDRVPEPGDVIESDGRPSIGVITSATLSPHCGCPIGLGYVNREYATADHPLVVQHHNEAIPAVVASLPFYSRS